MLAVSKRCISLSNVLSAQELWRGLTSTSMVYTPPDVFQLSGSLSAAACCSATSMFRKRQLFKRRLIQSVLHCINATISSAAQIIAKMIITKPSRNGAQREKNGQLSLESQSRP